MPLPPRLHRGFNRGRWELQRERARLEALAPPPPDCPPRTLGEGVAAVLQALGPKPDPWLQEIAKEWPKLVGPDIARHTRPACVERKVLLVYVDNSVWLSELQRYGQKRMLANLQNRFGTESVPALRLRLDPDGMTRAPEPA